MTLGQGLRDFTICGPVEALREDVDVLSGSDSFILLLCL